MVRKCRNGSLAPRFLDSTTATGVADRHADEAITRSRHGDGGRRLWSTVVTGEELPLTGKCADLRVPNRTEDIKTYDFDAPPEGLFRSCGGF